MVHRTINSRRKRGKLELYFYQSTGGYINKEGKNVDDDGKIAPTVDVSEFPRSRSCILLVDRKCLSFFQKMVKAADATSHATFLGYTNYEICCFLY